MTENITVIMNIAANTSSTEIMNCTDEKLDLPEGWKWPMVINMICVMVVGGVSNLFTLISLPYVRVKYPDEFFILQSSAAVLLLHLAACDFLYCFIGFPHLIQVYILGSFPYSPTACWTLGMLRNVIAYADFTTIAMIAVCVAKQKLCKKCRRLGNIISHGDHDSIFGGLRIIGVCVFIWCIAFISNITHIFEISESTYGWSASIFGCNTLIVINEEITPNKKGKLSLSILGLLTVVIFISYALIAFRVIKDVKEENGWRDQEKHTVILLGIFLSAAFMISVLPEVVAFQSSSFANEWSKLRIRSAFASIYWWLYGTNLIFYVTTNSKLRQAFARFLKDMFKKRSKGRATLDTQSSTHAQWWSPMRT